jgi:hypothetical protein
MVPTARVDLAGLERGGRGAGGEGKEREGHVGDGGGGGMRGWIGYVENVLCPMRQIDVWNK